METERQTLTFRNSPDLYVATGEDGEQYETLTFQNSPELYRASATGDDHCKDDGHRREKSELLDKITTLEIKNGELEISLKQANEDKKIFERRLRELRDGHRREKSELLDKITSLEGKIGKLEISLKQANEDKKTFESQLQQLKEEAEKTLVTTAAIKSSEAEDMRKDYVRKIEKDEQTIQDLRSKVANLEKEKSQLTSQLDEVDTSRTCWSTIRECFGTCCWLRH